MLCFSAVACRGVCEAVGAARPAPPPPPPPTPAGPAGGGSFRVGREKWRRPGDRPRDHDEEEALLLTLLLGDDG